MPPIPIVFHTRPTIHRYPGVVNTSKQPLFFSIDRRAKSTTSSASPPQLKVPIPVVPATASSSSSTSNAPTPPAPSARRKSSAPRPPPGKYITLTPLNSAILDRCLLVNSSQPVPSVSPRKTNGKSQPTPAAPPAIHPYSRLSDLGNDRSPNPSPREILRNQRLEAERARTKKDSVAAARAAIAAKKKPKARNGRAKAGSNGGTSANRSPSPSSEVRGLLGLGGSGLRTEVLPTIMTELASPEVTPVPTPTSRSLKRTRSTGLPPLSTGLANALSGGLGIGSPLKAVIGAGDEEEENHRTKRSRTQEPVPSALGNSRKKSHSPHSGNGALAESAPAPKTVPLAPGKLVPGVGLGGTRTSARASSVAVAGGANGEVGGTSMRRAVSAAGGESARRDSMTSQGSEGVAAVRARREVNLPRALRDYETRPGTMV